jgi:hypothetical protein
MPVNAESNINDRLALHLPYGPAELPPDLAAVINVWPNLPEPIRAGIVAMAQAASSPDKPRVSDDSDKTPSGEGVAGDGAC